VIWIGNLPVTAIELLDAPIVVESFENKSSISTDSITSVDAAAPCGKKRDRKGVIFLVPNPYLR